MVPPIVNIIIGPKLSPLISQCVASWDKLKEYGFTIKIWNDDLINAFVSLKYPFALEPILRARNHAEAADIARYLIIYHHGGYYVDWDIELLDGQKLIRLAKKARSGFLILDPENGTIASECFSARKNEPYLLSLVNDIVDIYHNSRRELYQTPQYSGPYRMRDSLVKHLNSSQKIISVKEIFAYDYSEIRQMDKIKGRHQPLIHYWLHTWIK